MLLRIAAGKVLEVLFEDGFKDIYSENRVRGNAKPAAIKGFVIPLRSNHLGTWASIRHRVIITF